MQHQIGQVMKELRLKSNFKQKDLASKLGVTASLLSMIEKGKREPNLKFIEKFCGLVKISMSELFNMLEKK